jgi:phosphotriesterase-related protein
VKKLIYLKKAGVSPSAFVWVHANGSNEEFTELAKTGCWISLDGMSEDSLEKNAGIDRFSKKKGFSIRC